LVIQQNRYILAAQQLTRLWAGALGRRSGPVESVRAELDGISNQAGERAGEADRRALHRYERVETEGLPDVELPPPDASVSETRRRGQRGPVAGDQR
jgi:hypothetical protein